MVAAYWKVSGDFDFSSRVFRSKHLSSPERASEASRGGHTVGRRASLGHRPSGGGLHQACPSGFLKSSENKTFDINSGIFLKVDFCTKRDTMAILPKTALVRVSCIQNTQIRGKTIAKVFEKVDTFWTYQALELTFTGVELDEVLAGMKLDSAPSPDGLHVLFFKRFWGTLKAPILQMLNDFVLGRINVACLNYGVISLIPKSQGADNIKHIRSIALINVIFKFIAKAYATRLAPVALRTINRSQTAFIKGRSLHEGVLALHEIAHELRVKKLRGLLLKRDFEKAFDLVSWGFPREVLLRKGFSPMIVHRLMQLVSGGQTAVNVNGVIGDYFRNARGVRQGDPLSPILFDFMVDSLAAIVSRASESGTSRGSCHTLYRVVLPTSNTLTTP
ncbi:hypothetical protein QYE76_003386 [Lolium multiflorum]|uniref:Reverse transcriptase domain-containing protein n=1 Tax=Lolium multiflorum TaxID=4521 RepID=A0AAD8W1I8_LOLMU|nr:hypothetical protein QYE76_003386 [Lolium multiflorum]